MLRPIGGACGNVTNCLYDGEAFLVSGAAEGGVLAVEVWDLFQADEKLAAGRVGVARAGHRKHSWFMRSVIEFGGNLVARATSPTALGAASLNHEALDHPVKAAAVVEPVFSQGHHVSDVPGSLGWVERQFDWASRGFEC